MPLENGNFGDYKPVGEGSAFRLIPIFKVFSR